MTSDLIEFVKKSGLGRILELSLLRDAVMDSQRAVEKKLDGVSAMEWPRNIFAEMYYALERDDIDAIRESITQWQEWLDNIPPEVKEILFGTLARVKDYVRRYEKKDDNAD